MARQRQRYSARSRMLTATLVALLAGCGGDGARKMIAANNDTNVKRLGTLYGYYQLRHEFHGPRSAEEFRAFIKGQDPARLALAGISPSALDDLFVSERDRLPLRIRYGVDTRVRGPEMPVVFEQTGRAGRRHVGFTGGSVQEVESATYDALWAGASDGRGDIGSGRDRGP